VILLTGATGTAGSFIANEFVRERVPVRILVRHRAKAAGLENVPTVEIAEGDMSRPSSLELALDGVDRVLMISAPLMDMVETQKTFIDAVTGERTHRESEGSENDGYEQPRPPRTRNRCCKIVRHVWDVRGVITGDQPL
jgi:hypothetical protein